MDDLEVVFAPVLDIHQGVGQRSAIVAGEVIFPTEDASIGKDIRRDDLVEQALEFAVGEADAVEGFEFLSEVFSSEARSRISGRSMYLRLRSFSMNPSSMPCSLRTRAWGSRVLRVVTVRGRGHALYSAAPMCPRILSTAAHS